MRIKNYEIENFIKFLLEEELSGKYSRLRMRFIKILKEKLDEIEYERRILIDLYAKKDENSNPIMNEDENVYEMEDIETFKKEYFDMMNEEYIISETEEREEMLKCIRHIVLNTIRTFKNDDAIQYDRWCDIVEGK